MTDLIVNYSKVMRAEIDRLSDIAHNVANANTPGYAARSSGIDGTQFLDLVSGHQPQALKVTTDQSLGALQVTSRSLDLAVASGVWFVVQQGDEVFVTRNGAFQVDSDGNLRTANGAQVLGQNGPISQVNQDVVVNANGEIYFGDELVDQLKVISLKKGAELESHEGGLYSVTAFSQNALDADASGIKIVQGALTGSNVNVGDEMVKMMEISRHIESVQRAMSTYDELLNSGISELGK